MQKKYGAEEQLQLVYKSNPDKLEIHRDKLNPIAINAIKELDAIVQKQTSMIESLLERISKLESIGV